MFGAENIAGLTHALVTADRAKLMEDIQAMQPKKETALDKAKETFDPGKTNIYGEEAAKDFGFGDAYRDREKGMLQYDQTDVTGS